MRKYLLGKVFISHSSKDKPFVRCLAKRLWDKGFRVWLDEKELVPGDALATRLSEALKESRVVVVVVSASSVKSKWLAFELNKATERMVEGKCRIIPVLKGKVSLPPELKGVIYADFRQSFEKGFARVLAALETEVELATHDNWAELDELIEAAFDSVGSSSTIGGYKSVDCHFVTLADIHTDDGLNGDRELQIIYDVIHDYGRTSDPLDDDWLNDYRNAQDGHGGLLHLVVTERPVAIQRLSKNGASSRVKFLAKKSTSSPFGVVFADLNGLDETSDKKGVIEDAREQIRRIAKDFGYWDGQIRSRYDRLIIQSTGTKRR